MAKIEGLQNCSFFLSVPLARENLKENLKHKNRAKQLTNVLAVDPPAPPSERLLHVLIRGLNQESEEKAAEDKAMKKNAFADLTLGPSSRTELLESLQGTIHILRKHFYSTKFNLTYRFFTKIGLFRQNNRISLLTLHFVEIFKLKFEIFNI